MPVNIFGQTSKQSNTEPGVTKKYVDTNFIRNDGNLSMGGYEINNLKTPTSSSTNDVATTKGYVDDALNDESKRIVNNADNKYLSKTTGGKMGGPIDMNEKDLHGLEAKPSSDSSAISFGFLKNYSSTQLAETLLWEYYTRYGTAIYRVDRGISSEVTIESSRKISKLFDRSLHENHAEQRTTANQPTLCSSANRLNNRYYMEFNGIQRLISDINLNVQNNAKDIVNIFIVYKMDQFRGNVGQFARNGLFGHDNGGYDKFVCFSDQGGELVVAGTTNNHIVIGSNAVNGKQPIADFQSKANAGRLGKWCCLSIHWDVPAGADKSSVWCNGKKLCNFTARTSVGSNQMTFGDLNPGGVAGLYGSIAFFALYKEISISDSDIKLHHHVLCKNWYKIDHDDITLD